MKLNYFLVTLLAGLFCGALPMAQAEPEKADSTEKVSKKDKKGKKAKKGKKQEAGEDEEAPAEDSVVGAMLRKNTYFNNPEPNFNAKYFIFLQSASWCGPCNMEMPGVVKEYEKMKASGKVELILLSNDKTQEEAQAWFKKFNATFPAVMKGATIPDLPPIKGIPSATIMNANGDVIEHGHGAIIRGWKKQTIGEYAVLGDDGEPRVGKALKGMKFANGKPNAKADIYIYLYAPTPDEADEELLTDLAKSYKEMKKEKVEVIFISTAKTPALLTKRMKQCKAKFPVITKAADGVSELPGLGSMGNEPQAWVVTQSGASITSGTPDIATNWQKFVEANK